MKYKVTYIENSGKAHAVEVADGWSLMEGAVKHLVPGIDRSARTGSREPWCLISK